MTNTIEKIEADALGLPAAERSRLVERLIESLETDPEWAQAWAEAADEREARISRAEASWLDGDDVLRRLRATLA
jgi:hypothetical protein